MKHFDHTFGVQNVVSEEVRLISCLGRVKVLAFESRSVNTFPSKPRSCLPTAINSMSEKLRQKSAIVIGNAERHSAMNQN